MRMTFLDLEPKQIDFYTSEKKNDDLSRSTWNYGRDQLLVSAVPRETDLHVTIG